jgi:hypothetical protein
LSEEVMNKKGRRNDLLKHNRRRIRGRGYLEGGWVIQREGGVSGLSDRK